MLRSLLLSRCATASAPVADPGRHLVAWNTEHGPMFVGSGRCGFTRRQAAVRRLRRGRAAPLHPTRPRSTRRRCSRARRGRPPRPLRRPAAAAVRAPRRRGGAQARERRATRRARRAPRSRRGRDCQAGRRCACGAAGGAHGWGLRRVRGAFGVGVGDRCGRGSKGGGGTAAARSLAAEAGSRRDPRTVDLIARPCARPLAGTCVGGRRRLRPRPDCGQIALKQAAPATSEVARPYCFVYRVGATSAQPLGHLDRRWGHTA